MSRYCRDFQVKGDVNEIFNQAYQWLTSQGFVYKQKGNEMVFQKGIGLLLAPQVIKLSVSGNIIRIEAWINMFIWFGESDCFKGFYLGIIPKNMLKKVVRGLEQSLSYYSVPNVSQQQNYYQQQTGYTSQQQNYSSPQQGYATPQQGYTSPQSNNNYSFDDYEKTVQMGKHNPMN
ncbi:MAG: hypothetical protein J1G06_07630 [Oscillospiraceae bacterium]|nr:hypothetical protein [Oscillospiraceae bacterium]